MTIGDRSTFENLLLMCPIHHDVIDADATTYTIDRLTAIKREHEKRHKEKSLRISGYDATRMLGGVNFPPIAQTVNQKVASRVMGTELKIRLLVEVPREKQIVVWFNLGSDKIVPFAQEIFEFMKSHGFDVLGDGPVGTLYLKPLKGIFVGLGKGHNNLYVGYLDGTEKQPNRAW